MSSARPRPSFQELPLRKDDPPYSAWGYWGNDDQLGTLNHLTPDVVRAAAQEIQKGDRFSLNLRSTEPKTKMFGRENYENSHKIIKHPALLTLDDTLSFNTQLSTQWDGLRHFGYQKEQRFYNGVTLDEVYNSDKLGIQEWHKAGCIAGRGVLIDYASWAEREGVSFEPLGKDAISYDNLMRALEWQSKQSAKPIELRKGDILIVRSGHMKRVSELPAAEERTYALQEAFEITGVEQDERLLQWLWDHEIAAVAGDAPGFENFSSTKRPDWLFHEVLLAGWGCPIGEFFWLEELAKACLAERRWTFFLSASPLHVDGLIGSPANIQAIM
ncbi:54S ribosomal protein L4, mitochondrial [Elsinoe australis]|uniref:54S ribosomal protein L4, mitochondrial n=1 Tax=Elsinoe australis TaxID=40998 RepID=A0A2P7ZKB3_9PEZI|nr:54S ribosomal protein L4, mitochondrial [Elsinoe australis]